jgi:hypothetical protein
MSTQSAPAAPDYTPIAEASKASSAEQTALAREQFDWAKQTYADNKGVTDKVVDSFLSAQDTATKNAATDRARYEGIYQPLEDDLVAKAKSYASPERKALEMGRAQATVGQQFAAARTNAQQSLEAYGVDPSATRFAALDIGVRAQEAASKAGAGNQASANVDATANNLETQALNIGKGYPGQVVAETGTGLQAGTGAVNSNLATTASGASTMGTAPQYFSGANSALNTWGNTLNQGYSNALGAFNANNNSSSGVGSALGLAAGVGMQAMKLATGGAVDPDATTGGAVPTGASPSGGKAIDDVNARLTSGEFVIPRDAVEWYGQEKMHKLIEKSRQDRQEMKQRTGAVPTVRPAAVQAPTFASRPGALPIQRAA